MVQTNSKFESGFTLLELLVAVTLIAVMAVGIWSALELCVNSWIRGIEAIDINQRERSTLDLVRKQLASAYPLIPNSVLYSTVQNTTVSSSPSLVFSGAETSLRFVSPNSLQYLDGAGMMLVAYEVEEDSDGNTALVEKEVRYTGQSVESGGFTSSVPVFLNLKECLFEYYDSGTGDSPAEWVTEWDTSSRQQLPAAVRISMIARDSGVDARHRQMIIPLRAEPNFAMGLGQSGVTRRRVIQPTGPRTPGSIGSRSLDGGIGH